MNIVLSVMGFFGRLLRDMWLAIWLGSLRPAIVRVAPWLIGLGAILVGFKTSPEYFSGLITNILAIAIVVVTLKWMVKGIFFTKKKKRRK